MNSSRTPSPDPSSQSSWPVAPTQERWDALSAKERVDVERDLNDDLNDAIDAELASLAPDDVAYMAEGDAHYDLCANARGSLRRFFSHHGRSLYVAANMGVHYPGEPSLAPDLLAVRDVLTHDRSSFMVAQERKGLDLCLEVIVFGRRRKDLVENVERYARLGIHEYFVLDVGQRRLRGYRLPPGTRRYQRLVPNHGHFSSEVLGLEIGYREGRLRFYAGNAILFTPEEESDELGKQLREAEEHAETEQQRAETKQQRADEAVRLTGEALIGLLKARRVLPGEAERIRIESCRDLSLLARWIQRAATVTSVETLFLDS